MQDIHSIGVGGAGPQLYGGVGDSRRVRPNQQQASINCPRCDSLDTKFCYYNNYNLSQPRYYCKGCRRYWTKGGVLRNVPVGGGCRKGKRAVPKLSNNVCTTRTRKDVIVKSNSNYSSEITSTSAAAAVSVTPEIMLANSNNSCNSNLPEFFKQQVVENTTKEEHIFKDVGNFVTDSISNDPNDINMSIMYQKWNEQWNQQHKIEEMSLGLVDEKVELSGKNEGGLAPVDWQNGDHGLFGIDTVYNYWSQLTQWGENNYSLDYFP